MALLEQCTAYSISVCMMGILFIPGNNDLLHTLFLSMMLTIFVFELEPIGIKFGS